MATKLVHNVETGEVTEIELTSAELAKLKADAEQVQLELDEAEAKAQTKLAAQAKLAALGLTVEDLQALGL
jgi:hypothetical protein